MRRNKGTFTTTRATRAEIPVERVHGTSINVVIRLKTLLAKFKKQVSA